MGESVCVRLFLRLSLPKGLTTLCPISDPAGMMSSELTGPTTPAKPGEGSHDVSRDLNYIPPPDSDELLGVESVSKATSTLVHYMVQKYVFFPL